ILGGLGTAIWAIRTIEPWCAEPLIPNPDWSQNADPTQSTEANAGTQNKKSVSVNLAALNPPNPEEKSTKHYSVGEKPWYSSGWWKKFFCESKIGDLAV